MFVRLSCEHTGSYWRRESLKTNMFYFWKGSVVSWNSCSTQFLSGNQEETAYLLRTILRGGLIHIWCSGEYWGQQSDVFWNNVMELWVTEETLFLNSVSWNFIDTGNRRLHRQSEYRRLYLLIISPLSSSGRGRPTRPPALCTCPRYPRSTLRCCRRGWGPTSTPASTCWSPPEWGRPDWPTSVGRIPGEDGCRGKRRRSCRTDR